PDDDACTSIELLFEDDFGPPFSELTLARAGDALPENDRLRRRGRDEHLPRFARILPFDLHANDVLAASELDRREMRLRFFSELEGGTSKSPGPFGAASRARAARSRGHAVLRERHGKRGLPGRLRRNDCFGASERAQEKA